MHVYRYPAGLRFFGMLVGIVCAMNIQAQQTSASYHSSTQLKAFPLDEVRLSEGPFYTAQQTDLDYILKLDPDRLLAPYFREAGLKAKATPYGNWESMGLDGHTAGHYLSALAQMYAATGNKACLKRLQYMVHELAICQQKSPIGYVGGVPGGRKMWAELRKGNFDLFNKKWVPWYNLHKLFSGLRDAYTIAHNEEAKVVLLRLADWAYDLLHSMNEKQIRRMLRTEYGGMNAVCADIYKLTGNGKYLELARLFSQAPFVEELSNQEDRLTGLHANTQIPKVIGFEKIALADPKDKDYGLAARFFWNTVVEHRTLATGGNSVHEHFNPIDDFSTLMESVEGPETCNSYNMLKLTELLFLSRPASRYMDYYERTLYNQILATQREPEGGFVYFSALRPESYRVYSSPQKDFWCCVGTGMENHGKYGKMIYSHRGADIFINLFIASTLNWREKGIELTQSTQFPFSESSLLKLSLKKTGVFTLYIRKPKWVRQGFRVKVNDKVVDNNIRNVTEVPGYIAINRRWRNGDRISIALPMETKLVGLPDKTDWACLMRGPVVLAAVTDTTGLVGLEGDGGRFDHIASGPLYPLSKAPLLVIDSTATIATANVNDKVRLVNQRTLTFNAAGLISPASYQSLELIPFFKVHDARYMIYWPVARKGDIAQREAQLANEDARLLPLKARTVDYVTPGEQQPETDHLMESRGSVTGLLKDRHWRSAGDGFFSYHLKMDTTVRFLRVTYYEKDDPGNVGIWINGKLVTGSTSKKEKQGAFFSIDYPVAAQWTRLPAVEVKFTAVNGIPGCRIFDVRFLK